jgi:integrase
MTTTTQTSAQTSRRAGKKKIATAIYRGAKSFEIQVCVSGIRDGINGIPLTTTKKQLEAMRDELKSKLRDRAKKGLGAVAGSIEDDADRFYNGWSGRMATDMSRCVFRRQLNMWIEALPATTRAEVTTDMVGAVMTRWATELNVRAADGTRRPYALETRGKLLRTLRLWWEYLDGPGQFNPGRGNHAPAVLRPAPRSLDVSVAERVVDAMRPTVNRARCKLMLTLGITQIEIMRLQEHDVDWATGDITISGRRKGGGSNERVLPFGERAECVAALREFASFGIWGKTFDHEDMRRPFVASAKKLGVKQHVDAYTLRHTFATELYKRTGQIYDVQLWLGHTNPMHTRRYINGAGSEQLRKAARAIHAHDVLRKAAAA